MTHLTSLTLALPPFKTLAQRHLVYAYCAVLLMQFGYGAWLAVQWRKSSRP